MKTQLILLLSLFATLATAQDFTIKNIENCEDCKEAEGTWYDNQCWEHFEAEGIPDDQIDSLVKVELEQIKKCNVTWNEKTYPIDMFMPMPEDGKYIFLLIFKTDQAVKSIILPSKKKKLKPGKIKTPALLYNGDIVSTHEENIKFKVGKGELTINEEDQISITGAGDIEGNVYSFYANEAVVGAGTSTITVKDTFAILSGDLGTITYHQIKDLIAKHPSIKTLVMTQISGSVNDEVNMHTGRLVRNNGFTTVVTSTSDIASGGVDLFCAGKERIIYQGAKIGIHSWCCVDEYTAIELPKNHPAHKEQLRYFTQMLGDKDGPEFYFKTLEAAPFDGIHYMTDEEIRIWKLGTEYRK